MHLLNNIINQNLENENNSTMLATWSEHAQVESFFTNLYSNISGNISITAIRNGIVASEQFHTSEINDALLYSFEQANSGKNVYFGLGLQSEKLNSNSRGRADTVSAIPGLWVDIDIADANAHSSSKLPPDLENALKIPACVPFKPSIIISSGYGLHIYWLFTEPWVLSDEAERQEAKTQLKQLQALLRNEANTYGWKLDNTANLAQLLRVPYTFNYKDSEKNQTVSILEADYDQRYARQDFKDYLESQPSEHDELYTHFDYSKKGHAADIIDNNCCFIQNCRDNSRTLSEPAWYAMVTNLCHTVDGVQKIHELSHNYPEYSFKETANKIEHAYQANAPHTCHYIRDELGFKCPAEGCGSLVVSPLSHATNSTIIAHRKLKAQEPSFLENPEKVYNDDILTSLALLKRNLPEEYDFFKDKLRGKINLRTFNKKVNEKGNLIKKGALVNNLTNLVEFDNALPSMPLNGLKVPEDYIVKKDGLYTIAKTGDELIISLTPVVITRYISNLDTNEQKVELAVHNQDKWRTIIVSRNTISTRTGIVSLPDRGLQVTSETAKYMVEYLQKFEMVNRDIIPTSCAVSHLGWSEGRFIPGCPGDLVLDLEENSSQIAKGFSEAGTLKTWKEKIMPLRDHPIARFIIAAPFASPLLSLLNHRVFIIHTWCRSKGGKTAATYAALSVWGDPDLLRASFKDTHVAIERRAALYCNLPLVIDEKQVLEANKYDQMEALIYQLTQGSSKGRGGKDGGFQHFNNWENICISSGEEPVTTNSSRAGMMNRVLEIFGEPIPDEQTAREIYSWVREQHGTAGVAFINKLIESKEKQPDLLSKRFDLAIKILEGEIPDGNLQYLVNIAVVMIGDYLSSVWVFDLDELTAWEEAKAIGLTIAQKICSEHIEDEAARAYEYIISWYSSNRECFDSSSYKPIYGFIRNAEDEDSDYICIYTHEFDNAMRNGGFNSRRIKQDWAEKGWLLFEEGTEKTKRRLCRRLKDPYTNQMIPFVCVKIEKPVTISEGFNAIIEEGGNDELLDISNLPF